MFSSVHLNIFSVVVNNAIRDHDLVSNQNGSPMHKLQGGDEVQMVKNKHTPESYRHVVCESF